MDESEKILEVTEPVESEEVTGTQEQEQNQVTETEEKVEFTDGAAEEAKKDEAENDKSHEAETKASEEKKKQTPEENSKYAQERRRKAELDNKVKEAYQKGRLEAYKGKINPYTNTEIQDETDIKVYENMYELEKSGKDPIADYASYIADKERELEKERLKQEELQKSAKQDIEDFSEKYPNVDLEALLKDESFTDYIEGKNKPLVDLYENFNKLKNQFRNNAINVAKQTIANANATPGSLGSGSEVEVNYENMSSEEFEKVVQSVIDGDLK